MSNTVKQMLHIGTVGEVPYVYTRSNRLKNFPDEKMLFIDHFTVLSPRSGISQN